MIKDKICKDCNNVMFRPRSKFKTSGIISDSFEVNGVKIPIQSLGEVEIGDEALFTYSDSHGNKWTIYDFMCGLCSKVELYGELIHAEK